MTATATLSELVAAVSYPVEYATVSAARLAQVVMHRGIGASRFIVRVREGQDGRPVTEAALALLRAAFCAERRGIDQKDDVPLGISMSFSLGDRGTDVIRAVAGCSHLVLFRAASQLTRVTDLYDALTMHQSLQYLRVSEKPSILAGLMKTVSATCRQLTVLDITINRQTPDQLDSILCSIATMTSIQCLNICSLAAPDRRDIVAPVLSLPRLTVLTLRWMGFDQPALEMMMSVLAQRPRPIRALLFEHPTFRDADAAHELFQPVSLQVLRRLSWLRVNSVDHTPSVFDCFIAKALPVMTTLQRLEASVNNLAIEAALARVRAAIPRPDLLHTLIFNGTAVPSVDAVTSAALAATLRGQLRVVPPVVLAKLQQLEDVTIPSDVSQEALLYVYRNVLPCLVRASSLDITNHPSLTDALADTLREVLPRMPSLSHVNIYAMPMQRHLLRRVFSKFRPYSLLSVGLRCASRAQCVVPVEVMRASASCVVDNFARSSLDGSAATYYYLPEHAAASRRPCCVPSLHDLCASVVLTLLPPERELGLLPEAVSRHSLRDELMPCDQCGVYRRLADAWICVRQQPLELVEVIRCYSCHVRSPSLPLASSFDVES